MLMLQPIPAVARILMDELEIEQRLMCALWVHGHEVGLLTFSCEEWCQRQELSWDAVCAVAERLSGQGLLSRYANHVYSLTQAGETIARDRSITPQSYYEYVERIRRAILEACNASPQGYVTLDPSVILRMAGDAPVTFQRRVVGKQASDLELERLVERDPLRRSRITQAGEAYLKRHELLTSIKTLWLDCISGVYTDSERGHKLEDIVAALGELDGARVQLRVRNPLEENDALIAWGQEFWLISCKWEKEPTNCLPIESLFSRLNRRHGARGIVVSANGFTQPAITKSLDMLGQAVIVLLDRSDIEALIFEEKSLREILEFRTDQLFARRNPGITPARNGRPKAKGKTPPK